MAAEFRSGVWGKKPAGPASLNFNHPQTRGLIAYWPVLASDGQRLKNLAPLRGALSTAGANGDALSVGGYKKFEGVNGPSVLLNGSTQRYVAQGSWPGNSVSYSFRTRLNVIGTGTTDNNEFIERGKDNTTWGFQMSLRGPVLTFLLVNQVPAALRLNGVTSLVVNRWYHCVATYDIATQIGALYLNGRQDATATMAATSVRFTADQYNIGATDVPQRFVNGAMDDIRVYNRALSPAEVQDIYQNPTAVFANQSRFICSAETASGPAFNPTQFFMVM